MLDTTTRTVFATTWYRDEVALCRDFVAFGCGVESIARFFGCQPRRIHRLANRMGWTIKNHSLTWTATRQHRVDRGLQVIADTPARAPIPRRAWSKWDAGLIDEAIALGALGWSASDIAAILNEKHGANFSRNSVLGRLYRSGRNLSKEIPAEVIAEKKRRAADLVLKTKGQRRHLRPQARPPNQRRFNFGPVPVIDESLNQSDDAVSLFDAKPHQCRYVLGEPKDMLFCGTQIIEGHSWCARHAPVVYREVTR